VSRDKIQVLLAAVLSSENTIVAKSFYKLNDLCTTVTENYVKILFCFHYVSFYTVYCCMFFMLLFNFVYNVFLLLCYVFFFYVCSVLGILFHCVVLCSAYV
jgi:hypothetical protein